MSRYSWRSSFSSRRSRAAGATWAMTELFRDDDRQRFPLRLEVGRGYVAEVLAVRLERCRRVTLDSDLVGVVQVKEMARALLARAAENPVDDPRHEGGRELPGCHKVEP